MKKKLLRSLVAFSLLLGFGLTACNSGGEGGGSQQSSSAAQEKITITAAEGKSKLLKGETLQLTASVPGVTWESKNAQVASVDQNGLVTALSKGSASISAAKEGYRGGSISITVDLPSITITAPEDKSMLVGGNIQLSASEQGVTWASSAEAVATVDQTGKVTGVSYGTATISASKADFNTASVEVSVVRPAPTAVLHMEDAEHYSSDGVWGTSYSGTMYGPGEESPVYARSSGNASDGTCIAYMDKDDTEVLTFTSSAAVKAELTLMMASRSSVSDMSTVMVVKFNEAAIDLAGKSFEGGGDTNTFVEFSFGDVNIKEGNNVLDFAFLASSPYFDDLCIYAESAATIQIVKPVEKDPVVLKQESLTVAEGKSVQIESDMTGLSYKSASAAIATVDENGLVTGVKEGATTIAVSKDGFKTVRLPVTVTAAEGVIVASINSGTSENDAVTFRTSQNLSEPYNYIVDAWPADAVLTIKINNAGAAGAFNMYVRCRASGGYNSSTTDDLATCMEVKVNGTAVAASGTVSGNSFTDYLLGEVNLTAGENTVTIKCLTTVPTMNMLRFLPKA